MKKTMVLLLAGLMLMLSACGGNSKQPETVHVDLQAYWDTLQETYKWNEGYMVDIEGEMLEAYYPGLGDIAAKQFIAKMPMMSSVVNEMVFMECETEDDAALAAALLQDRITTQAEGGAWYPESMEAWGRGIVIQQGTYVAMIASAEHQDEIAESFTALFQ